MKTKTFLFYHGLATRVRRSNQHQFARGGLSLVVSALVANLLLTVSASACGDYGMSWLEVLANRAVSEKPEISEPAIADLRRRGQAGLDAMLEAHAGLIRLHATNAAAAN